MLLRGPVVKKKVCFSWSQLNTSINALKAMLTIWWSQVVWLCICTWVNMCLFCETSNAQLFKSVITFAARAALHSCQHDNPTMSSGVTWGAINNELHVKQDLFMHTWSIIVQKIVCEISVNIASCFGYWIGKMHTSCAKTFINRAHACLPALFFFITFFPTSLDCILVSAFSRLVH